jgi:hypothetical protein
MSEDYSINFNQLQVTKEGLSKYEDIVRNGINHKILFLYFCLFFRQENI